MSHTQSRFGPSLRHRSPRCNNHSGKTLACTCTCHPLRRPARPRTVRTQRLRCRTGCCFEPNERCSSHWLRSNHPGMSSRNRSMSLARRYKIVRSHSCCTLCQRHRRQHPSSAYIGPRRYNSHWGTIPGCKRTLLSRTPVPGRTLGSSRRQRRMRPGIGPKRNFDCCHSTRYCSSICRRLAARQALRALPPHHPHRRPTANQFRPRWRRRRSRRSSLPRRLYSKTQRERRRQRPRRPRYSSHHRRQFRPQNLASAHYKQRRENRSHPTHRAAEAPWPSAITASLAHQLLVIGDQRRAFTCDSPQESFRAQTKRVGDRPKLGGFLVRKLATPSAVCACARRWTGNESECACQCSR